MRATKEMCEAVMVRLHRLCNTLTTADYDTFYCFLKACKSRLPTEAAVERDSAKKAVRTKKVVS